MRLTGVLAVNFEHISHCYRVSTLDFEQVHITWGIFKSDQKCLGLNEYCFYHFEKF